MDDRLIDSMIGGCRIESKIGEGGMGAVYKAHHIALDITVAVKIMTISTDLSEVEERFLREARIAAKLRHPNIAAVLNVGIEDGVHFLVMEYVEGENLRTVVEKRGRLPESEVIPIARLLAGALQKAYECGVIHRDIKPENILIDTTGTIRLIDLGLARSTENTSLTQSNTVLGSPHYVAPEQAENPRFADCRADIYSFGCTLYHLLSGNAPFPGTTIMEVLMNHINSPVPRLIDVVPSVSKELSSMIAKMMQKDPDDRYQSPDEILSALSDIEHENSRQTTLHSKKRRKKHDRIIVAGGTLIFVVIITVVGYYKLQTLYRTRIEPVQQKVLNDLHYNDSLIDAVDTTSTITVQDGVTPKAKLQSPRNVSISKRKKAVLTVNTPAFKESSEDMVQKTTAPDRIIAAVKIGDNDVLRQLLSEGFSPNGTGGKTTPLHEAVRRGLDDTVRLLLEKGADPNRKDQKGDTPLHYALKEDATYMSELLLKHGADPNIRDHAGKTPLMIAHSVGSSIEQIVKNNGGR